MHAWNVTPVSDTHAAMVELRAGGFDVIISDEDLEGESGSAMIRDASREGLLEHVGALMYTAEPALLDVPHGVRVLQKPMGIARLIEEVIAAANDAASEPSSGKRLKANGHARSKRNEQAAPSSRGAR